MSTTIDEAALSSAERIKKESLGLHGPLAEEVGNDATHLSEEAKQILKFHGSYQQEDRDQRRERKKAGLEPAYQYMVRSKLPGGTMTAEQYLAQDDLASRYGDGTLRVTTRQGFQFYGIVKSDLRGTIHALNEALITTLGACGDVVRNIITCSAPASGTVRQEISEWTKRLTAEFLPRTRAYHEIWVEGQQVTAHEVVDDPLYKDRYLPRKFKIGFAFPDDNCTDVFSNDFGLVVIADGDRLIGFNALVGGGLGKTHGKEDTYPRLASPFAFVTPDEVVEVARAVIAVQRDHGNRENRKRARLKYLLDERGMDWFRGEVEAILGRKLAPYRPVEVTEAHDHLGWHDQGDGRWFRGIWIQNGRIQDHGDLRLRTVLRRIVERYRPDVYLTTQQNLLLVNLSPEHREEIDALLLEHGVTPPEELSQARRHSMACPALPTCPLAVAESERIFPEVVGEMEELLAELGLADETIAIRMTGCPNGCARPYTADLAFIGRSLNKYVVYVGGNLEGTRLAQPIADLVPLTDLVSTVRPLFERYKDEREPGESFGDFWSRVGAEPLQAAGVR
ncbi:MAG TPA: NADPH-dependent assimilatory sulfite reductase hemoprotein subunit [Longimicrobiaceae bacterium]|nr:NADPH-dependent assimilatory sulfite reductase hemoprotein subunit [Longimicrobiaceae bacterium]